MGRLMLPLLLAALLFASVVADEGIVVENASRRVSFASRKTMGMLMWSLPNSRELWMQINLKNPWAKVIDTITAKNTGSLDVLDFIVCYPEHLASRIALIKVR